MKTFDQLLSELKLKTMGSYVAKASRDKDDIERTYVARSNSSDDVKRAHLNRSTGINTAKHKIKNKLANLKVV